MSIGIMHFMSAAPLKQDLKSSRKSSNKLPRSLTIAAAHVARREAAAERRSALKAPAPFRSAFEFLSAIRTLVNSMSPGANRQIADHCRVSTSTVSKWISGRKVPLQSNLDHIVEWWRINRDAQPASQSPSIPRSPAQISLSRLPADISQRLRRAARLRNVDPLTYASQILDRQLPSMESMQ
jgi:hypothetical protein